MRFALIGLITLSTGCLSRPAQSDVHDIGVRQVHRYDAACHSWLHSQQTGYKYCASPAFSVALPDHEVAKVVEEKITDGPETMEALMTTGEKVYGKICVACHQADGKGKPGEYPPLAGAGEFYGDPTKMAGIIINGLNGEIQVLGQTYNNAMPPQGHLSDYEIAAVATYARNSFGNADGLVTKADVKAAR